MKTVEEIAEELREMKEQSKDRMPKYSDNYLKEKKYKKYIIGKITSCLLYTSPSPRDLSTSRMPSSA